ncbi:hypothetical protein E4U41_001200 [Claviceps citrina]|nr:hypothetical protein E4U41_001200 [Claviceps citrina]
MNQSVPLDDLDNEILVSPLSSTGVPSTELNSSALHNMFGNGGYERVNLYGDTGAVNNEAAVSQAQTPQISSPHSASSNTLYSSNNHLVRSPAIQDGTSPEGRFTSGTMPKLHHVFQKFRPWDRTKLGAETPTENHELDTDMEPADDRFDDEAFKRKFVTVLILSIYASGLSLVWVLAAATQFKWNNIIKDGRLSLSSAQFLTAILAKTIELSFITAFMFVLGQIYSRRSISKRRNGGMTLAEINMRNWVLQPLSIVLRPDALRYTGWSVLGFVTILATFASLLYTTASGILVSPKLADSEPRKRSLGGPVAASYANVNYLTNTCPDMFDSNPRVQDNDIACMQIQFAGQSHRNLFAFISTWADIKQNGTSTANELKERPTGKHSLYENTTMTATWTETEFGNVTANFERYGRIINNVTMAMPHPGVYAAAMAPVNEISQPVDLGGVGEYTILAAVVSPTINVMCVNMDADELAPLVYTAWPYSNSTPTGVGDQMAGPEDWRTWVPRYGNGNGETEYLNRTVVDEIFRWGLEFKRLPPVFEMYPSDYNMVTNSSVYDSDAMYILAKSYKISNYTLCEMRSWVSPFCTTEFRSSGTAGTSLRALCGEAGGEHAYYRSLPADQDFPGPAKDWKSVADVWGLALDLNGGTRNNNATNARQLTQLILETPKLVSSLPSIAEALAAFAGSTLAASAIKTPYRHYWQYKSTQLTQDSEESFNAWFSTMQYTSGRVPKPHRLLYLALFALPVLSFCCLAVILRFRYEGYVTDFTDSHNLFVLAMNSPPSEQLKGSCGKGPRDRDLVVPWRVSYAPSANHYFLQEANETPWRGKYSNKVAAAAHGPDKEAEPRGEKEDVKHLTYRKLAMTRVWRFL